MHAELLAVEGETHWVGNLLLLSTVPALVALNGLFVAAEFALVGVRRTRVEEMVNQGVHGAQAIAAAIEHLDRSIAATQLGITLASIGLGFVGEPAFARILLPLFESLSLSWQHFSAHALAVGVAFSLITFMHVVFGELIPKTVALQIPDQAALWIARPLLIFAWITRPIILAMNGTGSLILRWCGFNTENNGHLVHSVEELLLLIEDTEEAGFLDADQAEFVENVFELAEKQVRDCMVPRDKMSTLDLNMSPEAVLERVRQGAHTRLPVYEGDMDNIVGIVNTKDLFYVFSLQGVVILQDALYPPLFLKPDESVANAMRLFRKARRPMALVREDDGKILGLITLEDILEEIVGDIEDEHDQPTQKLTRIVRRPPGSRPGMVAVEPRPGPEAAKKKPPQAEPR